MQSGLADFIELETETIVEQAVTFAKTVDVGAPLDEVTLRDHLPQIMQAIVADMRTPQSRAEEVDKSEGRAPEGRARSAAGTHALHRAHSGYSISHLISEYRALRASVLRLWAASADRAPAVPEEVTRFNEAIDEAVAESVTYYADEVDRWRSIFLGVLSHDLRNPLGAIVLTSELIARTTAEESTATAAQRLIRGGQRMRELLDKLLVYNRAQMGMGFEVDRRDIDLVQACREEIDLLQTSMPDLRIRFQSPAAVRGMFDAARIREALANLVINAFKYGTRGGEILVELREEGGSAEIVVDNPGEAIPRETLDLMFEPLRRGGVSSGELEQASLGLGLFIVSQIAQAHAGTISAESEQGKTSFRLHLPRS